MWTRLEELFDTFRVTRISIVGLEQTGKTNNAFYIANLFWKLALERGSLPIIAYTRWKSPLHTIKSLEYLKTIRSYWCEECNDYCPDSLYIIFDDISFLTATLSPDMRKYMNYISRIAHKHRWARRIVIVNIFHYSKATLPFLRISHVKIVTSLASAVEIAGLKEFFRESSLWRFYEMKTQSVRATKYYSLYNIYGVEFITKPPRASPPEFFWILRAPSKEQGREVYTVEIKDSHDILYIRKRAKYTDIYIDIPKLIKQLDNGLRTKKHVRIAKLVPVR